MTAEPCGFTLEEQIEHHEAAIAERKRALEKVQAQASDIQVEINVSRLEILRLSAQLDHAKRSTMNVAELKQNLE